MVWGMFLHMFPAFQTVSTMFSTLKKTAHGEVRLINPLFLPMPDPMPEGLSTAKLGKKHVVKSLHVKPMVALGSYILPCLKLT